MDEEERFALNVVLEPPKLLKWRTGLMWSLGQVRASYRESGGLSIISIAEEMAYVVVCDVTQW